MTGCLWAGWFLLCLLPYHRAHIQVPAISRRKKWTKCFRLDLHWHKGYFDYGQITCTTWHCKSLDLTTYQLENPAISSISSAFRKTVSFPTLVPHPFQRKETVNLQPRKLPETWHQKTYASLKSFHQAKVGLCPGTNQLYEDVSYLNKYIYIYKYYMEPACPLFLGFNPPKEGLFQSKQGSFGFQVYRIH